MTNDPIQTLFNYYNELIAEYYSEENKNRQRDCLAGINTVRTCIQLLEANSSYPDEEVTLH